MHTILRLLTMGFMVILVSCDRHQQESGTPYEPVTDIRHTMKFIIDPTADIIWDSAGSIITEAGERDLAPDTPEAWIKVEAAAAMLAESGNLLMMPGRSAGPEWDEYAGGLISAGKLAMVAARQQDADKLFAAGGQIYQACLACHNQYLIADSPQ